MIEEANGRRVFVVVDNPCWFDEHAQRLIAQLLQIGEDAAFTRNYEDLQHGDVAFFLSCMKIASPEILARSRRNIVVHESALPHGRGFSPLVWQILEGKNDIPVTMIEAAAAVDAGNILMQRRLRLDGTELNETIRQRLGDLIVEMCLEFLRRDPLPIGRPQEGEPTWYRRRYPRDSRIDPERSIAEQFDLFRVVNNEAYPAFFEWRGRRYILKIFPAD